MNRVEKAGAWLLAIWATACLAKIAGVMDANHKESHRN